MGGRAIKSIRPEPSPEVKARRLSDKHICSTVHFWKHIYAIVTLPPCITSLLQYLVMFYCQDASEKCIAIFKLSTEKLV